MGSSARIYLFQLILSHDITSTIMRWSLDVTPSPAHCAVLCAVECLLWLWRTVVVLVTEPPRDTAAAESRDQVTPPGSVQIATGGYIYICRYPLVDISIFVDIRWQIYLYLQISTGCRSRVCLTSIAAIWRQRLINQNTCTCCAWGQVPRTLINTIPQDDKTQQLS